MVKNALLPKLLNGIKSLEKTSNRRKGGIPSRKNFEVGIVDSCHNGIRHGFRYVVVHDALDGGDR